MFKNLSTKMANKLVGESIEKIQLNEGETQAAILLTKQGSDIRVITVAMGRGYIEKMVDDQQGGLELAKEETLAVVRIIDNVSVDQFM